jgi:hypothetical protein
MRGRQLAASPAKLDLRLQDLPQLGHRAAQRGISLHAARMRKGSDRELRVEQL